MRKLTLRLLLSLVIFLLLFAFSSSQGGNFQTDSGEKIRLMGIDTLEAHESKKLYRDAKRSGYV
jgi:hypothetical protein